MTEVDSDGRSMQPFLAVTKALGDENRVRILLSLHEGELCLCEIVEVLGLAPSTVSKHVDLLRQAGLVQMRKEGRWHYYRLAGREAPALVRETLRWVQRALDGDAVVAADATKLRSIRAAGREEFTACYSRS